jgi:hypothetical protein
MTQDIEPKEYCLEWIDGNWILWTPGPSGEKLGQQVIPGALPEALPIAEAKASRCGRGAALTIITCVEGRISSYTRHFPPKIRPATTC